MEMGGISMGPIKKICLLCWVNFLFATSAFADINDIVLNELLFNPGDISPVTILGQDCNGNGIPGQDGVSGSPPVSVNAEDEFIEFYNNGATDVDLAGYCISNRQVTFPGSVPPTTSRWAVPSGVTVPANGFYHICGGDDGRGFGFSLVDVFGNDVAQFSNNSGVNTWATLYEPTTLGNCGSGIASVIFSEDYGDGEPNGEPYLRCFTDGTSPLGFYQNGNGDFYAPSPGSANCAVSTPVYINHISFFDHKLNWQTGLEFNHIGFNLYASANGKKLHKLNKNVIVNSKQQDYSYEISENFDVNEIILVAVSTNGTEEIIEVIAESHEFGHKEKNHINQWQKPFIEKYFGFNNKQVNILVSTTGIQKVSLASLMSAGMIGSQKNLQLSMGDQNIPFYISEDKSLVFLGEKSDSIYSDKRIYRLKYNQNISDTKNIIAIKQTDQNNIDRSEIPTYFIEKIVVEENNDYGFTNSTIDPWTMQRMLAYTEPNEMSWEFELPYLDHSELSTDESIVVSVDLIGVTDFPGNTNDHHMSLIVNDYDAVAMSFDGKQAITISDQQLNRNISAPINVSLIQNGATGFAYDLVNIDKFTITYPRQFKTDSGILEFESNFRSFKIDGFVDSNITILAQNGQHTHLIKPKVSHMSDGTYRVDFKNKLSDSKIYIYQEDKIYHPEIVVHQEIESKSADILVLTKDFFIKDLDEYKQAKKEQGFNVQIADVDAVIAQLGTTENNPSTLKEYINRLNNKNKLKYVMIVGSDQYDYKNYLETDAISIVPTFYRNTGNGINHAPTDTPYVDFNNDNVADIPIGRLSVNNTQQLSSLINKILAYQPDQFNKEIFVTDNIDHQNFNEMAVQLAQDSSYQTRIIDSHILGIDVANVELISELNNGVGIVNWIGHSSSTRWSRDNIFDIDNVNNLINQPTIFYQLGCWNSYFVDPIKQNLSNALLQKQDHGAVATIGSSTYTLSDGEKLLATYFKEYINSQSNVLLGDAFVYALQKYSQLNPDRLDVLLGYQLLGDPSMRIK
jgi:hypothetical protein